MHGGRDAFSSSVYAAASAPCRVHSCAENASHVSTSTLRCRPRATEHLMLLLVGQIAGDERYKSIELPSGVSRSVNLLLQARCASRGIRQSFPWLPARANYKCLVS
jgi:hypothetical protein